MQKRLLALLVGIAACSRGLGRSTDSAAGEVAHDPPKRAARLTAIDGSVSLEAQGSRSWTRPVDNYTIATGDRLYAGPNGRAELDLGDGAIRLDHGGDLVVTNLTDSFTQLGLDQGALEASLYRYDDADSLEFDTPNGALVPTQAGTYIVSVEPNDGGTVVSVERGALLVTGPGLEQTLNAGQTVRLVGTNPVQLVALGGSYGQSEPVFSDLDSWRARRDPLYTSTGYSSRYVSRSIPGWEDLDDNGIWFTDAANTDVWCPTRVTRTWVPYRDGHWAWVRPWGWTWVEDEPWGYAPFHYGRWETVTSSACGSGWAWVPGPIVAQPVWAPALVAFAAAEALGFNAGPSVAWFPLAPSEPYFPWYSYSDDYLHDVNVTNLIEVRDVDPLLRDRDFQHFRWTNRDRGLTAVSAASFSAGDRVSGRELRVDPARARFANVIARPAVSPRRELIAGGRPAPAPRTGERPQMLVTKAEARSASAPQHEIAHGAPNLRERPGSQRGVAVAPPAGVPERPTPVISRNQSRGIQRVQRQQSAGEVGLPARGARGRTFPVNPPISPRPAQPTRPRMQPKTQLQRSAPQRMQPQRVQPQRVQPQRVQPQRVQPQRVEPQRVEPQRVEPQRVEPQRARPERTQPQQRQRPQQPQRAQPQQCPQTSRGAQPAQQPSKGKRGGKPPGGQH